MVWLSVGCAPYRPIYRAAPPPPPSGAFASAHQALPGGELETSSAGVTTARTDVTATSQRLVHVRMIVWNQDDLKTWSLDTRKQRFGMAGLPDAAPTLVEADGDTVDIATGQRKAVDLYFALPASVRNEGDLPGFELAWQILTGGGLVAHRTPFIRLRVEPGAQVIYLVPPAYSLDPFWLMQWR